MFAKGDKVRYSYNGNVGVITGGPSGGRWRVQFLDSTSSGYYPEEKLEKVGDDEGMFDCFGHQRFQGIEDYRRTLYRHRLSGELTNIMYSMNNAVTKFMPHQFIPVTRMLESYTGRLLIADEVGLGKTIEAMYIWQELLARENAKRLLIVVPAVLRYKWRNDLKKYFDIDADIVSAQGQGQGRTLLDFVSETMEHPQTERFVAIVSLEGLRTAQKVRDLFPRCTNQNRVFDLVIIDEAHYLRNNTTKSFETGVELRDASERLLLLSATPIQTSSTNFFNLLNLLAPEDFSDTETFEAQLLENVPLVRLSNALERNADEQDVAKLLSLALKNEVFSNDRDLKDLQTRLGEVCGDPRERVMMIERLKGKYFYHGYVSRTRKRDVDEDRKLRVPMTVDFRLNDYEKRFYDEVSAYLRGQRDSAGNFSVFRLIARQRQMASCLPGALAAWRHPGTEIDDLLADNTDERQAILEDILPAEEYEREALPSFVSGMPGFESYDLDRLIREDSKFTSVLAKIKEILKQNPDEKIIIFSFFRHTVKYLHERIGKEGIRSTYIMGDVDPAEKNARIERFRSEDVNILVSSEVGSEGIDLQFACYEINYDLPWNPMRLEQRIGRIDRIGQDHDKLFICNAFCENTIEDRVLQRLYDRIEVFRNTIGDLEEILGKKIQDLQLDLFGMSELTDAEIKARTEQIVTATVNQQRIANNLEYEAGNFASDYQRYVLDNIRKSTDNNRIVTPAELIFTVKDVLENKYPGSAVVKTEEPSVMNIKLSPEGRIALERFIHAHPSVVGTGLNIETDFVPCAFDKRTARSRYREAIDINHPLVRWILSLVQVEAFCASHCEALEIRADQVPQGTVNGAGIYAFFIMQWKMDGVRRINELRYYAVNIDTRDVLSGDAAERLLTSVMLEGASYDASKLQLGVFNKAGESLDCLARTAREDYAAYEAEQKGRNRDLVEEQIKYVERTYGLRMANLTEKIRQYEAEGNPIVHVKRSELEKTRKEREGRLEKLNGKLDCDLIPDDIAVGFVNVTGEV